MPGIWIDFCVNDPANGLPTGRVRGITFGGFAHAELDPENWNGYPFKDNGGTVTFLGRRWPYLRGKGWVGNWCWDAYCFDRPTAMRLFRAIKASGKFHCTGEKAAIGDWFDKKERTND